MKSSKITASLEDYLEAISNNLKENDKVRAIDIARALNVSRASVSEALRRLAEQKLIDYGRYGAITITAKGEKAAESVINRHKVLHKFLCGVLGMDEKEASQNACRIEHVITEDLLSRLSKFVDYNQQNPEFISNFKREIEL